MNLEVLHVECQESDDSSQALRYRYQVRYRGKFVMEKAPEELSHLTCVDLGMVAATMTMRREERVPVLVERTFGTGEYRYYGWQERDGKVFILMKMVRRLPDSRSSAGSAILLTNREQESAAPELRCHRKTAVSTGKRRHHPE